MQTGFRLGEGGALLVGSWLAVTGKSKREDLMGDLDPDRGKTVEEDGVNAAPWIACAGRVCFAPSRGVCCTFASDPNLWSEVDLARLVRSEGEAVDAPALRLDEQDEERSAPLSLFFALMSASGVLMGSWCVALAA